MRIIQPGPAMQLWMDVFVAVIRSGQSVWAAENAADSARKAWDDRFAYLYAKDAD